MGSTPEDIYERIQKQKREGQQQQRLQVANQVATDDYDRAARIFAVEANTKLPYAVVDADLENLEDKLRRNDFNAENYKDRVNGAPVFNEWAAENPYNIAVLERDRKNLTRLERSLEPIFMGWDSGWAMTEIAEIRDRQLTNFDNPDNVKDKARLDELRQLVEGGMFGADAWYSKVLVGTAQQVPIMAWLTGESLDEMAIGTAVGAARGAFIAGTSTAGVGTLAGAGIGAVTGLGYGARAGFMEAAFRLERGLAYDEYMGMGLNEEEARWAASAVGGVNAAAELIGLGALTKRIPGINKILNDRVGAVINSTLTKPTMRQATARATLMYGEGVATELLTEVFQEATLMVAGEMLKSNERDRGNMDPAMEAMTVGVPFTASSGEFWDRVGDIAAHTLYGVAVIGGVGPYMNFSRDSQRASIAKKRESAWTAMGESAADSETRQNAPSKYREFVERLTGKHGKIMIEAEHFQSYFQEAGMDPNEVAISVGVDNFQEALGDGLPIEIPVGQYLQKIASTDHHNGLKGDLKSAPDQMTTNEAIAYDKNIDLTLKEIQSLAAKEDPEQAAIDAKLIEKYKAQLVAAGTSPEAANRQATLMVGIPNLARRAGKDPEAFAAERFGGVVATTNAQMRADKEDVDLFVDPYLDRIRAGSFPAQRDILGPSLIDTLKARGGLVQDSELDARDIKLQIRGLINESGDTLDGAAEIAHEQGFIAERDPNLLLEAIEREVGGEAVFGNQFNVDVEQQELLGQLEQLSQILDQAGIDISNMSNAEVRAAMAELDTYYQTEETLDDTELNKLARLAFAAAKHDPVMLARLELMIPRIAPIQEFGDVQFVDDVTIDGKPKKHIRAANVEFERAKKRKNILDKLRDCLGG